MCICLEPLRLPTQKYQDISQSLQIYMIVYKRHISFTLITLLYCFEGKCQTCTFNIPFDTYV